VVIEELCDLEVRDQKVELGYNCAVTCTTLLTRTALGNSGPAFGVTICKNYDQLPRRSSTINTKNTLKVEPGYSQYIIYSILTILKLQSR